MICKWRRKIMRSKEKKLKKLMNRWFYGTASVAVAITLIITLNTVGHFSKPNRVYASDEFKPAAMELPCSKRQAIGKPQVEVTVDLNAEQASQKSVDAGHSPWKLDAAFVSQVFVNLKIYPSGIQGDYPIKYEEFKVAYNNGKEAVVEVSGDKTLIRKVYLKRLVRQDNTGIWTVVGYDPAMLK
jgi:hypothetical protein